MTAAKKKVLITQSNYIPWKGFFDAINAADEFIVLDTVQFTKRDWRNRNLIKTPTGLRWLSIPVATKEKYHQRIADVRVVDKHWAKSHWQLIALNYSKAPHFDHYGPLIEQLYSGIDTDLLSEINRIFLQAICEILSIGTRVRQDTEFELKSGKSERLLHICKQVGASEYLSGPSAKAYLDTALFESEGIGVTWLDYSGYPPYTQLYGAFEHGVSIVDLLLNEGEKATQFMKSFRHGV